MMNVIELQQLKSDLSKYLKFKDEDIEKIHTMKEVKLSALKKEINNLKNKEHMEKSTREQYQINQSKKRIENIIGKKQEISGSGLSQNPIEKEVKKENPNPIITNITEQNQKSKPIKTPNFLNTKPKILIICDVKGWAWWIKSEYLKRYLSEYYDIDIVNVVGNDATPYNRIDQNKYDLYFTWGFSYIEFLNQVPLHKKVTGVTAHRARNVIESKMKMAGFQHANSILLLKEMIGMGFKNTFYVPNGVDTELFHIKNPIKEDGELIAGHVGKKCKDKCQNEFIFPVIKKTGVKSYTNTKNWTNKIPHNEMVNEYNKMDFMIVCSSEDGTPNPALEAAACGRPIISNKIGNMSELIIDGYNGFVVPVSMDEYIDKINYFKNNRDKLIEMGYNNRKAIKDWDWKYMSKNYMKMFDTIFGIKRDDSLYTNIALSHLEKIQ
jgi:glycosyltransferase involved in cell wall biosynthesis